MIIKTKKGKYYTWNAQILFKNLLKVAIFVALFLGYCYLSTQDYLALTKTIK